MPNLRGRTEDEASLISVSSSINTANNFWFFTLKYVSSEPSASPKIVKWTNEDKFS